jgi:hypothetical protein
MQPTFYAVSATGTQQLDVDRDEMRRLTATLTNLLSAVSAIPI